jgi:predicted DNA-binding protein (UPF0251 family)
MKCRSCNSKNTRVTCTEHHGHKTIRYCRCLDCSTRYKTIETYEQPKRGSAPGYKPHLNQIKRGEESNTAVLTEENVKQIRTLAENNVTYVAIAKQFGVHKDTIYRIVKRKSWSHV